MTDSWCGETPWLQKLAEDGMKGGDVGESRLLGALCEGRVGASENGKEETSTSETGKPPEADTSGVGTARLMSLTMVAEGVTVVPEAVKAVALSTQRTGPLFLSEVVGSTSRRARW